MVAVFGRVSRSTSMNVSDNTFTKITGLSAETLTPGGAPALWHNTNQRYEIAEGWGGQYLIIARTEWGANQSGPRLTEAWVNGSDRITLSQIDAGWSATCSTGLVPPAVGTAKFNVGDYVELYLRQVSGATRTLAKVPEFSILRIAD